MQQQNPLLAAFSAHMPRDAGASKPLADDLFSFGPKDNLRLAQPGLGNQPQHLGKILIPELSTCLCLQINIFRRIWHERVSLDKDSTSQRHLWLMLFVMGEHTERGGDAMHSSWQP